jgi:hypothetical protein
MAAQFVQRIRAQQAARLEVELVRIADDAALTDEMPGLDMTFRERFAQFDEGIERVMQEAEKRGVLRLVHAMIEVDRLAEQD